MKPKYLLGLIWVPFLLAFNSGEMAPEFTVKNQKDQWVRLSDLKQRFVLLFFYPKDNTSGCTQEAQQFRDQYEELKKLNTVVFGVSRQDKQSHLEFISKNQLPYDLLIDSDASLAKSFGIDTMPILGFIERKSVLIGPDGRIVRFYTDVDPSTHAKQVLEDIQKLKANLKTKPN